MNWGIISAANIAYKSVVPAMRRSEKANVYAIASKSIEKTERFEIDQVYDNYDAILADENVEAVYIPLPNSLHHDMVIQSLQAGKHVLVEKPATISYEEMQDIADVVHETGQYFLEGFMYQHHAQHDKVQELLASIGEIQHVKSQFSFICKDEGDIRLNPNLGGGALHDVGCYSLHAITQIVGFKPVAISMVSNTLAEEGVDRTSHCTLFDQNGKTATFTCSLELPFNNFYEIIGEKGIIKVTDSFRPDRSKDGCGHIELQSIEGDVIESYAIEDDQYLRQIELFEDDVEKAIAPTANIKQSLEMAYYIEQAYVSAKNNGQLVHLDEMD